jgi:hypothetical protein
MLISVFGTEDVKAGLVAAVNAFMAGKPGPVLDFQAADQHNR